MFRKIMDLFIAPEVRQAQADWERIDAECARIESRLS